MHGKVSQLPVRGMLPGMIVPMMPGMAYVRGQREGRGIKRWSGGMAFRC